MNQDSSQPPRDGVAGLIERVSFHNEESGFAVLRLSVQGRRELVTVVGCVPSVNPGEWLTAEGRWVRDKEHGLQLKADFVQCTAPVSKEGIEKYLGSGMIKGIGPVFAGKLVAKFGERIFDIVENESARLQEIDGIGPGRRREIKKAWAEQKAVRQIMVFLHSNGVGTSRAVRIYKTYGERAIDTVRANPYTLAKDIPGIGFKTADKIAEKTGIPRDSILRARAGIAHILQEAGGSGHCALPKERLLTESTNLLAGNAGITEEALARLLVDGEIAEEEIDGQPLIFLPALQRAEREIAARIRGMSQTPAGYPVIDIEKAIAWCESRTGTELAPSQRQAIEQAVNARVFVLTGGPGVGKTTLLQSLLLILQAKKVKCLLCAPTGRAAKRLSEATGLEAGTIHRLLESASGSFARNERHPLVCDLLVVDETSMLDVPLMHKLLNALPPGAHFLLAGDVDQLPSVGPGMALSHIIQSGIVPVVRLTEVFRQAAASRIITTAHRVREGGMPDLPENAGDSDFYFIEREDPQAIQAAVLELARERIPKKLGCDPIRDIQVLCPMNRGSLGAREMNLLLQESLNPLRAGDPFIEKFGWLFRPRDKVIQTENNYDKDVFNGDIGHILSINADAREVTIRFDKRDVSYDFNDLDQVSLAYAITIHKSQGSEFPAVIIPLATQHYMLLQRNLIYTAITRGARMVVLTGQKKALSLAVRNNNTTQRYSGLLARLRGLT